MTRKKHNEKVDNGVLPSIRAEGLEDSMEFGRNGTANIRGVEIYFGGESVILDGLSKRTGKVINGGFKFSRKDFKKVIEALRPYIERED
jgi:hypothetical protein